MMVVDQRKRLVSALRSDHRPSPIHDYFLYIASYMYLHIYTNITLHYITHIHIAHTLVAGDSHVTLQLRECEY